MRAFVSCVPQNKLFTVPWEFVYLMLSVVPFIMVSLYAAWQSLYNRIFLFSKYVPKPYHFEEAGSVMKEVWSSFFPHSRVDCNEKSW